MVATCFCYWHFKDSLFIFTGLHRVSNSLKTFFQRTSARQHTNIFRVQAVTWWRLIDALSFTDSLVEIFHELENCKKEVAHFLVLFSEVCKGICVFLNTNVQTERINYYEIYCIKVGKKEGKRTFSATQRYDRNSETWSRRVFAERASRCGLLLTIASLSTFIVTVCIGEGGKHSPDEEKKD